MTRLRRLLVVIALLLAAGPTGILTSAPATTPILSIFGFESCGELHEHYVKLAFEDGAKTSEEEADLDRGTFIELRSNDPELTVAQSLAQETPNDPGKSDDAFGTHRNVERPVVDEPDVFKVEGPYFYVLQRQALAIGLLHGTGPVTEIGRIEFSGSAFGQRMLIGHGKIVVLRERESVLIPIDLGTQAPLDLNDTAVDAINQVNIYKGRLELLEIDVGNPADPVLLRKLALDGHLSSAERVGDDIRISMRHNPLSKRYSIVPIEGRFRLDHWYPQFTLDNLGTNESSVGYIADCSRTYAPGNRLTVEADSGPTMTIGLAFDLERGISEWGSVAQLAVGGFSSATTIGGALLLSAASEGFHYTAFHHFNMSEPLTPKYRGSGSVTGVLASSTVAEEGDIFYMASYERGEFPVPEGSSLTVVQANGRRTLAKTTGAEPASSFVQFGKIEDLGHQWFVSVLQYANDSGFALGFGDEATIQILDLSDPVRPRAVQELTSLGHVERFYLFGENLLLVFSHEYEEFGGIQTGIELILFDISDPASPSQIERLRLHGKVQSKAATDPRAFLYREGIVWFPVAPSDDVRGLFHDGAFVGIKVSPEGMSHVFTLGVNGEAQRAIVFGDQVHLLSDEELRTYSLPDGVDLGTMTLPRQWDTRWIPLQPE